MRTCVHGIEKVEIFSKARLYSLENRVQSETRVLTHSNRGGKRRRVWRVCLRLAGSPGRRQMAQARPTGVLAAETDRADWPRDLVSRLASRAFPLSGLRLVRNSVPECRPIRREGARETEEAGACSLPSHEIAVNHCYRCARNRQPIRRDRGRF